MEKNRRAYLAMKAAFTILIALESKWAKTEGS